MNAKLRNKNDNHIVINSNTTKNQAAPNYGWRMAFFQLGLPYCLIVCFWSNQVKQRKQSNG